MKQVEVAVGVVRQHGRILISKRLAHTHQGGLWEFPGGKVEQSEHVLVALARELFEELNITINREACAHLIDVHHDYGDKQVWLRVYQVSEFEGEVMGREGQQWQWVTLNELNQYAFPQANRAIVQCLQA